MTLRDELMDGWMNGAGKRTNEEEQEWKKRCTCLCDRMGELKASTHQGSCRVARSFGGGRPPPKATRFVAGVKTAHSSLSPIPDPDPDENPAGKRTGEVCRGGKEGRGDALVKVEEGARRRRQSLARPVTQSVGAAVDG
jgi:hypothetical protein